MQIYPAVDLRGGSSVRLVEGDFTRETDYGDPVTRARQWITAGATWLHVVDLDAARTGDRANREHVAAIAEVATASSVAIQLGGGIRSEESVADALGMGVERVVVGTAALEDPEGVTAMLSAFPSRIAIGIDYRRDDADGGVLRAASHGWTRQERRRVEEVLGWYEGADVAAVIVTDIGRDGRLGGPDIAGLEQILAHTDLPVVASGGVSTVSDIEALRGVRSGGRSLEGVIVGRALYEGSFTLDEALEASA